MDGYEREEINNDNNKKTHSKLKMILFILFLNPFTLIVSIAGWVKMILMD